jgi:hypothetical protein
MLQTTTSCESRMREIRTSGLTRGKEVGGHRPGLSLRDFLLYSTLEFHRLHFTLKCASLEALAHQAMALSSTVEVRALMAASAAK